MTSEVLTEKDARPIFGYRLEAEEDTARRIFLKALRSFARRNRGNSRRHPLGAKSQRLRLSLLDERPESGVRRRL